MEAKDKKILFFDIDGTLLTPPPFSIPESTVIGLKKAQEQGDVYKRQNFTRCIRFLEHNTCKTST